MSSSKKKKQAKLKRVINAAKREERKTIDGKTNGTFAALQLLNDPQGFSEKLFARLQVCPAAPAPCRRCCPRVAAASELPCHQLT